MNAEEGKQASFQRELTKVETIAGLRQALDLRYRRLCEAARSDWERLFGDKDPADACVSVRVTAIPSGATRGSDDRRGLAVQADVSDADAADRFCALARR